MRLTIATITIFILRLIQYIDLEFYDDFDSYNLEIFYFVRV